MSYEIKNAGLIFPQTRTKRSKTEGIIIHHPAHTSWTVKQVHDYHTNINGWNGIGYNFYIHKDGTIYEGRGLEYQGAHVTNYNAKTIGICCQGDFEYVDTYMSDAQYNALVWLIRYCQAIYGDGLYIKGHKDVSATACPGKNFPLEEVKKLQYRGDTTATVSSPSTTKTIDKLALEVISGKWGNGDIRKAALTQAGYDYASVQAKVNEMLGVTTSTTTTTSSTGLFSIGAKVKIKMTATNYCTGESIPASRKQVTYTIQQVGTTKYPNGILIKEIYSWVDKNDVELL